MSHGCLQGRRRRANQHQHCGTTYTVRARASPTDACFRCNEFSISDPDQPVRRAKTLNKIKINKRCVTPWSMATAN